MTNIELADNLATKYGWTNAERDLNLRMYNLQRPEIEKPVVNVKRIKLRDNDNIDISHTWGTASRFERGQRPYVSCGVMLK